MFSLAYNVITVLKQEITVRRVIINGLKNNNLKRHLFKKDLCIFAHYSTSYSCLTFLILRLPEVRCLTVRLFNAGTFEHGSSCYQDPALFLPLLLVLPLLLLTLLLPLPLLHLLLLLLTAAAGHADLLCPLGPLRLCLH